MGLQQMWYFTSQPDFGESLFTTDRVYRAQCNSPKVLYTPSFNQCQCACCRPSIQYKVVHRYQQAQVEHTEKPQDRELSNQPDPVLFKQKTAYEMYEDEELKTV